MRIFLAIAAALTLAACATTDRPATNGNGATAKAAAAGSVKYCWRDRLVTHGDGLACNWHESAAEACESTFSTTVAKTAVASGPVRERRCNNGQWLVAITMR